MLFIYSLFIWFVFNAILKNITLIWQPGHYGGMKRSRDSMKHITICRLVTGLPSLGCDVTVPSHILRGTVIVWLVLKFHQKQDCINLSWLTLPKIQPWRSLKVVGFTISSNKLYLMSGVRRLLNVVLQCTYATQRNLYLFYVFDYHPGNMNTIVLHQNWLLITIRRW